MKNEVIKQVKKEAHLNEMAEIVRQCQSSGMKVKDWCSQNNIGVSTYYSYLRRVKEVTLEKIDHLPSTAHKIVEIPIEVNLLVEEPLIIQKGDIRIEVKNSNVAAVMKIIEALLC